MHALPYLPGRHTEQGRFEHSQVCLVSLYDYLVSVIYLIGFVNIIHFGFYYIIFGFFDLFFFQLFFSISFEVFILFQFN